MHQEQEKKIDQLNKKLKWYAENQQLLDRDSHALKVKDTEIAQLKQRIQQLNSEVHALVEIVADKVADQVTLLFVCSEWQCFWYFFFFLLLQSGAKAADAKLRTRERAADAKRIQDLERQVREMENIVKKRHPNSLPVLMWAASTAGEGDMTGKEKTQSVQFLEKRINKLEQELEAKDEEEKRSVRVLEQKYNAMKVCTKDYSSKYTSKMT